MAAAGAASPAAVAPAVASNAIAAAIMQDRPDCPRFMHCSGLEFRAKTHAQTVAAATAMPAPEVVYNQ
jgi:hypothetical protein